MILPIDKEYALALVRENGARLREFPTNFKNDKDIVLAAINETGIAFCYASYDLQDDRDVVLATVTKNGTMLTHVSAKFKDDEEVVIAAMKQYSQSIQYAGSKLKYDKAFILKAITQHGISLMDISLGHFFNEHALLADPDIVLSSVTLDGRQLYWANVECKKNRQIVLAAIKENDLAYMNVDTELKQDPAVLFVLQHRHSILDVDWSFIIRALLEKPDYFLNPEPAIKVLTDGMDYLYLMLAQYALNKDVVIEPEQYPELAYD